MSDWDEALEQLDAGVARQIRQAVSRAGLQAHDPDSIIFYGAAEVAELEPHVDSVETE